MTIMALMLNRAPCMLRGAARISSYVSQQSSNRLLHFSPPRATADSADGSKKKPVGKTVLAKRLLEACPDIKSEKAALNIMDELFDDIMLSVAEGEVVTLPGFGTFKKRTRAARKGRNPSTGAALDIPEKAVPAFSSGTVFKGVVEAGSWEAYDQIVAEKKKK